MKHIGFGAPLPYLAAFLLILVCGRLADWARKKYDVPTVRKFFQVAAQTISSIGMILLCFKPSHVMAVIYMVKNLRVRSLPSLDYLHWRISFHYWRNEF